MTPKERYKELLKTLWDFIADHPELYIVHAAPDAEGPDIVETRISVIGPNRTVVDLGPHKLLVYEDWTDYVSKPKEARRDG